MILILEKNRAVQTRPPISKCVLGLTRPKGRNRLNLTTTRRRIMSKMNRTERNRRIEQFLTDRGDLPKKLHSFEAELLFFKGKFFLAVPGVELEITQRQAQLINVMTLDFIMKLDCHELGEPFYGKDLAERMHQAFEDNQKGDMAKGVRAALAVLDQSGT
jgi:hypothetical protein